MKRIAVVFGTRPEAIKLAPLILSMKESRDVDCHVCVTAQHREMLDDVLTVFDIRPDTDLDLMTDEQTLAGFAAKALEALDRFLTREKPDFLLVQGDTTTVFCAALAAFYRRIPVGHVEAGLRTGNLQAPWPEEMNRVLASRLAELHFAPTARARDHLLAEGIEPSRVHVTGNTVVDALLWARKRAPSTIPGLPDDLPGNGKSLVLITCHRREHFDGALQRIFSAIKQLAQSKPEVAFVFPVHRNPEVRRAATEVLGPMGHSGTNIHLIEPLPYLPFIALMERSTLILTDSGGIQEEAPTLNRPVLVLRDSTERPEGVDAGAARLTGTGTEEIIRATTLLLEDAPLYRRMCNTSNPYGDGKASERILKALRLRLGLPSESA